MSRPTTTSTSSWWSPSQPTAQCSMRTSTIASAQTMIRQRSTPSSAGNSNPRREMASPSRRAYARWFTLLPRPQVERHSPSLPRQRAAATPMPAPTAAPGPAPAPAPDPVVPDSASKEAAEDAHGPTEITVAGRARPPTRGASDYAITVGQLSLVPRKNAAELLKLAPGIMLSNEGGEGHAEQVFLRGFDAKEGQDIEFSLGGMPINESGNLHGNGYADTHFIIPELVSSLRVIEGPFDPRQGNYAVAGSANYELGLAQRGFTAKFTGGSFGSERLLLLWGPAGESKGTLAGAEILQNRRLTDRTATHSAPRPWANTKADWARRARTACWLARTPHTTTRPA